jgi:enamine deaminase RidA (YjgF/YER057c/UK114 family)
MAASIVTADGVPASPPSSFSQALSVPVGDGALLTISGQVAMRDGEVLAPDDMGAQATICYTAIQQLVEAAGGTMDDVISIRGFVTDISRLPEIHAARAPFLGTPAPTSTVVEVSALVLPGIVIEVEALAYIRN